MNSVIELLKLDEGVKLKPYRCTEGKLTIGVGRNIEERGISEDEAEYLLRNDIKDCVRQLETISCFSPLSEVRRAVLISMCFMGFSRLKGFKKMWRAIELGDYNEAAAQMLDSKWARQVKGRAIRLAEMMRTNEWPQ